ncbi:hypothetical protein BDR26DRAFT_900773 [Obelidium mucronatum]|nr:hypothetical protein BDR26DRAFT_900773 [Obelidium mucronatum]
MNRLGDAGGADFCICLTKVVALPANYKPPPIPVPVAQTIAVPVEADDGSAPPLPPPPPPVVKQPTCYVPSILCSLDMASNGLGMETVQALSVLLKKGGKNLRMLDFSCNRLGDAGAAKTPAVGHSWKTSWW